MANSPQARKRARQNEKRELHNSSQRSAMRTSIKKLLKAIQNKDKSGAQENFKQATSLIDRLAGKLIHANKAARLKSRLSVRIKELSNN